MTLRITKSRNVMTIATGTVGNPKPDKFKSETAFWYALKKELNANHGMNLIKKVMGDDGHLVGGNGYPYYLRDRKWKFCIHDAEYAIRDLAKEFNSKGCVSLTIHQFS